MLKSLGQVPFGVWCGAAVILAAAWMQDGLGFILGILIIGFTAFTSIYAKNHPEKTTAEPEDDGWGSESPAPSEPSDSSQSHPRDD